MIDSKPPAQSAHELRPDPVFIIGMHRSGTSALSGALEKLGLSVGKSVMPGEANNPKGYFENLALINLHDRFLGASSCGWNDPKPLKPRRFRGEKARAYREELLRLLPAEFGDARPLIKDPRMCRIIPLWRPLIVKHFPKAYFILPIRHPVEVASSLHKRDGMSMGDALRLWMIHVLEGERATREFSRSITTYDQLVASTGELVTRLAAKLHLSTVDPAKEAVGHIDANLRHHANLKWPQNEPDEELILSTYEALAENAPDMSRKLDRLRKAYYRKYGWTGVRWW